MTRQHRIEVQQYAVLKHVITATSYSFMLETTTRVSMVQQTISDYGHMLCIDMHESTSFR